MVGKKRGAAEMEKPVQQQMPAMPMMNPMMAMQAGMGMNMDDQQKMMMQFPSMFNQFMMNA